MATGGGNLYPNWLGSASLTIPTNTVNTNVSVVTQAGVSTYTTTVDVVPKILQSFRSTTTLNTGNPSEMLAYTVPATGWYNTTFNAVGSHVSASNWNAISQLDWGVLVNNSVQSNTVLLVEPQYICGDSVSEFITLYGGGTFHANQGDVVEWTVDGNTGGGPAITTGFFAGFGFITLQKIG
jgi:hypothetical protein